MSAGTPSKLDYGGKRVEVAADEAAGVVAAIMEGLGCSADTSGIVAGHLVDSSLCGVESHGVMRVLQYGEQIRSGHMNPAASPFVAERDGAFLRVDGGGGHGIPAMGLAFEAATEATRESGMSVTSVTDLGHTGRHGAFAEKAAEAGMVSILVGGGNREIWRQVAPHGGAAAKLPTNPWCVGLPGGDLGPVVMDFATSKMAGGWLYAARSAGAKLPEGCLIDSDGNPTTDPGDYFNGGAILPAAGHKGYAMALAGELIAEALIGPVSTECNWLLVMIDAGRMAPADTFRARAEAVLEDIRNCPPAPGFDRVEVPGERERRLRADSGGIIAIPVKTWKGVLSLRDSLPKR